MSRPPNPFDRFELDPASDLATITEVLRERVEEAEPAERAELRLAWEALTLHPRHRLELALTAIPETRAALGPPPPRIALTLPPDSERLSLTDLVGLDPVERRLPRPDDAELALRAPRHVVPRAR